MHAMPLTGPTRLLRRRQALKVKGVGRLCARGPGVRGPFGPEQQYYLDSIASNLAIFG